MAHRSNDLPRRTVLRTLMGTLALGTATGLAGAAAEDPRELVVEGTGPVTRFEFETTGEVTGEALESTDTVWGPTVEGQVSTEADTYRFSGDLVSFQVTLGNSEDIEVTLDGEPVAVTEVEAHVLEVRGTGPTTRFKFAVSGSVTGCGLEDTDTVRLHGVEGQVSTEADRYTYTGRLNTFEVTDGDPGDLELVLDGEETAPRALDR